MQAPQIHQQVYVARGGSSFDWVAKSNEFHSNSLVYETLLSRLQPLQQCSRSVLQEVRWRVPHFTSSNFLVLIH